MDSTNLSSIANLLLTLLASGLFVAAFTIGGHAFFQDVLAGWWMQERPPDSEGPLWDALRRLGDASRGLMRPSYATKLRTKLVQAGEPRRLRPEDVFALQLVGAGAGLLLGLASAAVFPGGAVWIAVFFLLGAAYPRVWLRDRIHARRTQILRALPYNLDLLTLAVEAGLDFAAALNRVVERGKKGPFREELHLVLKQLKIGKTREEALRSMIQRVELPPLTLFVTSLIQADRMGTSMAKVLRAQSNQLRVERTQRAEKLANEAPVKMLFPLIACIFPTVFLILFGPIVFSLLFGGGG